MSGSSQLGVLLRRLEPVRRDLSAHKLYGFLTQHENVIAFMEQHVFAIWDFMTLLKAVQRQLTRTEGNWWPTGSAVVRRLVNEIVLEEESDEVDGVVTSQFELYRSAMRDAGASSGKIDRFIKEIENGCSLEGAIASASAPVTVVPFMRLTERIITTSQPHAVVAALALGWEDVVTNMFTPILAAIPKAKGLDAFRRFLERRIEQSRGGRASMLVAMLAQLCGDDRTRWREAGLVGAEVLAARLAFWSAMAQAFDRGDNATYQLAVSGALGRH